MKVVQINATCGTGSTGKICVEISKVLSHHNVENYILFSNGNSNYPLGIKYIDDNYIKLQALVSRLNGRYGFNSTHATKKIIRELRKIKPDIIHLHNLHGHNCNLEMLFDYIREESIKVFWTFHDCWAFTGYCTHFVIARCDKWKYACSDCPQFKKYSWFFDKSNELYKKKSEVIKNVDLTVITPSYWMADLVKESIFGDCNIKVINNGIDLSVFKPINSNFREKYNIDNKTKLVLGVAFGWGYRKGLDVFIELARRLNEKEYQIVLVGTDYKIEKELPNNIISINRTQDQKELAAIYSAADVFVNPTREDTFPTVNIEAIACGTPVVTFKTGGSPEIIEDGTGIVIANEEIDELISAISSVLNKNDINVSEICIKKAKKYNQNDRFIEYYELYKNNSNS